MEHTKNLQELPNREISLAFGGKATLLCYREMTEKEKWARLEKSAAMKQDYAKAEAYRNLSHTAMNEPGSIKFSEVVQCEPWSSGPCTFTKLVDHEGKDIAVWTDEEIEEYL
jgi:hypothetical protein